MVHLKSIWEWVWGPFGVGFGEHFGHLGSICNPEKHAIQVKIMGTFWSETERRTSLKKQKSIESAS